MNGVFEVYKDQRGEHRFRLKAPNGQTILQSEGYTSKAACMNGIQSVKENAAMEERFETSVDKGGKHRFNLLAGNRQIIGTSEGYQTENNMQNGIKSVGRWAPDAPVKEV